MEITLFLGHLVLEKTLKAYWVKIHQTIPPKTHNLIFIAEKSNLKLSEEQRKFLATVTDFNLEARYPDEKLEFYNLCHIEKAYLFGSYANGTSKEWSDIDLALISENFKGNRFLDKQMINPIAMKIDNRFEIHPYKTDEFNENIRWFTKEITEHGIEIMP